MVQNQSLEEVKDLILGEIKNIKNGNLNELAFKMGFRLTWVSNNTHAYISERLRTSPPFYHATDIIIFDHGHV